MKTFFHHSANINYVHYGIIKPIRQTMLYPPTCHKYQDKDYCDWDDWHDQKAMEYAYEWLERQTGFYPLFMSVGWRANSKRMTGYATQFLDPKKHNINWGFTGPGDDVLFSYRDKPPGLVFNDYSDWHLILNNGFNNVIHRKKNGKHYTYDECIIHNEDYCKKRIFKKSYPDSRWLREANSNDEKSLAVQGVVPELNLVLADEIWVPNKKALSKMIKLGFDKNKIKIKYLSDEYN